MSPLEVVGMSSEDVSSSESDGLSFFFAMTGASARRMINKLVRVGLKSIVQTEVAAIF